MNLDQGGFLGTRRAAHLYLNPNVRAQLEVELKKREQERLHPSLLRIPGHPYNDLLTRSRYKIYYGGRDSAKSWSVAEALVQRAAEEKLLILCTREFQSSIKDSVHRLLVRTIWRLGLHSQFEVTKTSIRSKSGSEFIFKGLRHNTEEIKSTEGINIVWVEEAHNTSEDSWQLLIPTIRENDSEIWITFNVTDEECPTHIRFVTNTPDEEIPEGSHYETWATKHWVNYDQNPYLTDTSRKEIEYLRRVDVEAFQHVYGGLAKKISDSIIFRNKYRVEDFSETLYKTPGAKLLMGADFGFSQDPSTLIRSFILNRILYVEYESYGVGVELEEMHDFYVNSVPMSKMWPIKGDSSRPETISFLRGKGFAMTAASKWKGCVEDGITHLRGFEAIIIHPRCKHTIEEARLYSYKKDRVSGEVLPIIVDKHNHCWDAIRYSLDGYIKSRGDLEIWNRLGKATASK